MQAIVETLFDAFYLVGVVVLGIIMILKCQGIKQYRFFGIMAVVLGVGDSFHLVPRAYALCTTGLENYTVALGIGKFITSITMTIFYILLYYIWRIRYQIKGKGQITVWVYVLAALRIVLCLFPQNGWLKADASLLWGIYRNIPFTIMGLLIIVLFYKSAKETQDEMFRYMWLTIVLSFGFSFAGRFACRPHTDDRDADDPENLRVCMDGAHRIPGNEKGNRRMIDFKIK